MKEVAAISHKTSEEASQVSSSFEQLQEIAQTLQTGISRFKLS
jgi:methyl-accepting chemotaxis protein PixJ